MRLNIGAGVTEIPGYTNVDRKLGMEAYPLDYPNESVEAIYASHVLEHFSYNQTLDVLKDWVRTLKPGGVLKVAVPDFDKICEWYLSDHAEGLPLEAFLLGSHKDENDHHGAIFNEQKLRELLRLAGLTGISRWKSEINDCAGYTVSLNLMGRKPSAAELTLEGVHAVLSMPRLAFTDQATCLIDMAAKLKVPTYIRQGVFWGQTMTVAMEQAITSGAKYILTIDYDTIFTPDNVRELYRLMIDNPQVDAVMGMQVGRDRESVLLTIKGENGRNLAEVKREDIEAELLAVSTGHFGLTLIRVESLQKMAKPWFLHHADPDGGWGDGRIDEDIHFWRAFENAGLKLFQANQVRLGHLQLMVSWPGPDLQPIHQYVNTYRREGAPKELA